jgi:hypothetical protein
MDKATGTAPNGSRNRLPGRSGAPGSSIRGQRIFWCALVSPATEYGNSIGETSWRFSRAPQRNAANAAATSRTGSAGAARSIP